MIMEGKNEMERQGGESLVHASHPKPRPKGYSSGLEHLLFMDFHIYYTSMYQFIC